MKNSWLASQQSHSASRQGRPWLLRRISSTRHKASSIRRRPSSIRKPASIHRRSTPKISSIRKQASIPKAASIRHRVSPILANSIRKMVNTRRDRRGHHLRMGNIRQGDFHRRRRTRTRPEWRA